MVHLLNAIDEQLAPWLEARCQGAYRMRQVRDWLFGRRAVDFQQMTNLPQAVRGELVESFKLWTTEIARHTQAEDGTEKLLLTLADGGQIECVLLRENFGDEDDDRDQQSRHSGRRTICISTQVGCG